jgi:hypothetical protein
MIIYTAITANYDQLKEQPSHEQPGLLFEAFLDREYISQTWNIRRAISMFSNSRLNAKYHKILSHICFPDDQVTLWIDGSVKINPAISIINLVNQFLSHSDLAVFAHCERYCIYQESATCLHRRKDVSKTICHQVFRYAQEGYPINNGLAECTILLRRNTKKVREFNELWWNEILTGSIRDQISFPYVAWKTGLKINYIPGTVGDGTLFTRKAHLKS